MKKEEIEQAAKEWADNFDSYDPTFAGIKRMTAEISYRKGAEMLNERQPYSKEDVNFRLADFTHWVRKNYSHTKGGYRHRGDFYRNDKPVTLESLVVIYINLWEETK